MAQDCRRLQYKLRHYPQTFPCDVFRRTASRGWKKAFQTGFGGTAMQRLMTLASRLVTVRLFCACLHAQNSNGALKVTSFPSGANVAVDGVDTGKLTPMSVSLPVGDHNVVVSIPNSGWNPDTRTVSIN